MRVGKLVRRGRYRLLALFVVLGAVASFGAIVGVSWAAGWEAVLERLRQATPGWFAVAFACQLIAYAGYVLAYREVARVEDGAELGFRHTLAVVAAGFGVFVAAGGYFVDTEALEDAGLPPQEAKTRVLGLGALEYVLLAPTAAAAAAYLLWKHAPRPDASFTWPWVVAVPLGFVAAVVGLRLRHRLVGDSGWRRHAGRGLEAVRTVVCLASEPLKHGHAFVGMAAYWVADMACLWACLRAFGIQMPVAVLVVTYATGYALTRRTLPLGGAGIVEALLPFALLWGGSPLAASVLAVFAYRAFNLWLLLLPALAGLPIIKRAQPQSS